MQKPAFSYLEAKPQGIEDGIPLFAPNLYWGKAPASVLEEGLKLLDQKGWKEFEGKYTKIFDVTNDESRADWRFPIPVNSSSTVLDIGAGMGRITVPLSRIAKEVVAFDPSVLRMRYLRRRLEKENIENVELFVGDIFTAPLKKKSFDVIVLNGILEWVGLTKLYEDPREAQQACLRICKDLLKDGGHLYIGIENRAALAYIKAADHGGLMYTSYMPRPLASLWNRIRKGEPYKTYTYTKRGYDKLIQPIGFSSVEYHLPYPGYNIPRIVIPYENLAILRYTLTSLMPATNIVRKIMRLCAHSDIILKLYRHFFYSFNIILRK